MGINYPNFEHESSFTISCGIDEVGRGPIAGHVVAACVSIAPDLQSLGFIADIQDSKKLSAKKRDFLHSEIIKHFAYGIGRVSPQEIDQINIHQASLLAMKRAYGDMLYHFELVPDIALIDGKFVPDLGCKTMAIIKGDGISKSIAAASIVAKVTRDREMCELHDAHPYYGWDSNAGYPTKKHIEALNIYGITKHHRQSYGPVSKVLSQDSESSCN